MSKKTATDTTETETAIDATKPITLSVPLDHDGKKLTEITMRRAKVKDVRAAKALAKTPDEIETILLSNLSGLPIEVVEEMDLADYGKMQEWVISFLPPGLLSQIAKSLKQ